MKAQYSGTCRRCNGPIEPGMDIWVSNLPSHRKYVRHAQCPPQPSLNIDPAPLDAPDHMTVDPAPADLRETPPVDLGRVIAQAVQQHLNLDTRPVTPAVDEAAVQRLIDAALERALARLSRTVSIEVTLPDGTVTKTEGGHYLEERAIRLAAAKIDTYYWGPAGSGKTTMALRVAKALGFDPEVDTFDPTTANSRILGYRTVTGEPVETATTRAYAQGFPLVAEEIDNTPASIQNIYNTGLANGHLPAAWGRIPRGAHFLLLANGNTPGGPTPMFPDRRPMSAAFKDRLYFVHVPIDPAIEQRACGLTETPAPTRAAGTCTAAEWGLWIQQIRAWAAANAPTLMVTPRATHTGLRALAVGETPLEVAHGLVFRGADAALVDKALTACPLPGMVA